MITIGATEVPMHHTLTPFVSDKYIPVGLVKYLISMCLPFQSSIFVLNYNHDRSSKSSPSDNRLKY